MKRSRSLSVAVLASLLPIFFFLGGCNAVRDDCPPSSCGTLKNITDPFRLNTDPQDCGQTQYQLSCENDQTVLNLTSGIYYVEEISYKKQAIRIVDPGLQKGNCSSFPLYSLPIDDSLSYGNPYQFVGTDVWGWPETILFVKCSVPMNSSLYTAAMCFNTYIQDYLYVIMDDAELSELDTSCTVVLSTPVLKMPQGTQKHNYSKIHDLLLMGFELSWKQDESVYSERMSWKKYLKCMNPIVKANDPNCDMDASIYDLILLPWRYLMPCNNSCNTPFQSCKCFVQFIPCVIRVAFVYMLDVIIARTLIGVFCVAIFLAYKLRIRDIWMDATVEEFLSKHRYQTPTRYSYSDIKKMTQGFKVKLGQGSYGSVYRGKLRSRRLVAVKMLSKSKGKGQDFISEIATIGRIHHVNVVRLIGFCSEGFKRALIYDFMPNGSLEKYIFPQPGSINPFSWEKTYDIALGIARGIEYLHRGCDMRILHFDIKPHNILLDQNYIPKVSDFGLAKFYPTEESIVSLTDARGTIGYMAPELFYKNIGGVSYKSDVYSFGMLLMEMAGRRRNLNEMAENSCQIYFPLWIYDQLSQGNDMGLENATEDEEEIVKKLIIVALWCIQTMPVDRPSMGKVLEMLEGSLELLQIPSKPFLSSPARVIDEDHASKMNFMGSSVTSDDGLVMQSIP
ncbi:rust resistance kinase Lr10-like isoform X2 [Tasmannia lanceolata]|uniref:rust resistance kinase Lr10-like isoform X2 n=1 Tax=Tasmannia lanceolata TaxID=3420 RepID=UPI004063BE80